jgi:hypothetical protein
MVTLYVRPFSFLRNVHNSCLTIHACLTAYEYLFDLVSDRVSRSRSCSSPSARRGKLVASLVLVTYHRNKAEEYDGNDFRRLGSKTKQEETLSSSLLASDSRKINSLISLTRNS